MSLVLSIYKCINNINIYMPMSIYTLVGGLEHVLFFIIYGIILPIDFHILWLKPPTRYMKLYHDVHPHTIFIPHWDYQWQIFHARSRFRSWMSSPRCVPRMVQGRKGTCLVLQGGAPVP